MKKTALIFTAAILLLSCKNTGNEAGAMKDSKQAIIDSMNIQMTKQKAEAARQKSLDSIKSVMAQQQTKHESNARVNAVAAAQPTQAQEKKRKGWSGAAKGAVIGAGAGVITGALTDKHHQGRGAVIGGLAGAGLGAGTGAILDSKKKKEQGQ